MSRLRHRAIRNPACASDLTHAVLVDLEFLASVLLRIDGRPPSQDDIARIRRVSPEASIYMDWIVQKGVRYLPVFPPKGEPGPLFYRWVVVEAIRMSRRVRLNMRMLEAVDAAGAWVLNPIPANAGDAYIAHAAVFQGPISGEAVVNGNMAATTAYLAATGFRERNSFLLALMTSDLNSLIPLRILLLLDSLCLLPKPVI